MMSTRYIYSFSEGNGSMKSLLGGKGANLAEMTNLGLPVPPGFTITTKGCLDYFKLGRKIPEQILNELPDYIRKLEENTNKGFGDINNPLLVSVRSGAAISMPGMMDTILNLGLNDKVVKGLAKVTNNERFAYDCYRRFIQMYGEVVLGVPAYLFSRHLDKVKDEVGVKNDPDLTVDVLKRLISDFKEIVWKETNTEFPEDPEEQLIGAIEAVFKSWQNRRAVIYREANGIPHDLGTAVNVQAMVFGNTGNESGTGVLFTRNPSTGENVLYGEFLKNAQGEDVVSGARTPMDIAHMKLEFPEIYEQLLEITDILEKHYCDMQDIEFTIENGRLYLLQTRTGKRTARAAIKIAVDMVKEGLITKEEALMRVEPKHLEQILHRQIDTSYSAEIIAKGLPASPGAASGIVVFDADEAEKMAEQHKVILVSLETTPEDIHGVIASEGVLTTRGGMTSHAAVVARGMGKPCVCGCESIKIDFEAEVFTVGKYTVKKGDLITINGGNGDVILGEAKMIEPELSEEAKQLLAWADEIRSLKVRANADNGVDAFKARSYGAEGIGLCRTEHMFMAPERVPVVQELILSETEEEQKAALDKLLPMQINDFIEIFEAMEGLPVTIRLLDPPLHEFLPGLVDLVEEVAHLEHADNPVELRNKRELLRKVKNMSESNPMLGFRGCRLGIIIPAIYEMQMKAIFTAVARLAREGKKILPEVMIPLIAKSTELKYLKERLTNIADEVLAEAGVDVEYKIGTMIELPRAALTADEIAEEAEFFSFGTNDLTQTTFGFSRDDAEGKFLHSYLELGILSENPFMSIDQNGVGKLIQMAINAGHKVRPDLKVGICGEHGGDPKSIEFFHRIGLNYVSCSPYRVPIARLAAAQAALKETK
ncbi:pyruvate, phosphate dikinase [Anoxybacter fermentans]|uniref:Pyruvate, phosphate dikinase n=2 Tax=Anoxybacter fermentans TaxID=1323375 RepID=A0A3Q9HSM6_9FIRM|nr:pyruvate, phosphate dikinase [Anoxybacter fermentans]